MTHKNAKGSGQYFIRVYLCSGTNSSPLGSEELAIFCQCGAQEPSTDELQKDSLLSWVNSNPKCKKNQSNELYKLSRDVDAIAVVFLAEREIQACQMANRIFPCMIEDEAIAQ